MIPNEMLSNRDAAAYLGVAESTLNNWRWHGKRPLQYVKLGHIVRYRKSDLDAFISANLLTHTRGNSA